MPGLILGLHFHLWVAGVRSTSVATATFIFATNPVLFAIAEVAVYRRRLSATDWCALALAAAGGAWLVARGGGGTGLAGAALCFAATLLFVLYLVASEKVSAGTPHPTFVCLIYLAGGLLTLPIALVRGEAATAAWNDGGAWLALAALALLPTLVGHASNTYAVRFFPPILVSFTTLLEPVLASLAALAVLGERPPAAEAARVRPVRSRHDAVSRRTVGTGPTEPARCPEGARLGLEPVPDPVHGQDVPGVRGIGLDLLAQLHDVLVERAGRALVADAPHLVEDGRPVERLALVPGEEAEQVRLPAASPRTRASRAGP